MNIVPTCGNFDPENHTSTLGVIATAIWSLPGELYALDISKPPMLLPHVLPNLNMPTRAFGNFIGVKNPILSTEKLVHITIVLSSTPPHTPSYYTRILPETSTGLKGSSFVKRGPFIQMNIPRYE